MRRYAGSTGRTAQGEFLLDFKILAGAELCELLGGHKMDALGTRN